MLCHLDIGQENILVPSIPEIVLKIIILSLSKSYQTWINTRQTERQSCMDMRKIEWVRDTQRDAQSIYGCVYKYSLP